MLAKLLKRDFPMSGVGSNETTGLSIYDWAKMFAPGAQVAFNGNRYQAYKTDGSGPQSGAYASSAPVFALASVRILLFSEARFQFQQMRNGKPGDLFGTPDLAQIETPWPGHTTRDLLTLAELDILQAGNSYWVRDQDGLFRLDPKHVKLLYARAYEQQTMGVQVGDKLIGYAYLPDEQSRAAVYDPTEVLHYKPHPHATNPHLGMSWLNPCLPDVSLDNTVHTHKMGVIENGATLSTVVTFDETVNKEKFELFVAKFNEQHSGPANASKTLFLGGGADVKTVGQTFENLALQATQGAGEVRIAACAGVPPAIVGFSEGLKGSTLNAGNYGEARRRLSDALMRPLWAIFAGAAESLIKPPGGARLWYDDSGIAFLREDLTDVANIMAENTKSIRQLVDAGYEPDAAIEAVTTDDLTRLIGRHTGLFSVQLQPPMSGTMPNPDLAQQPALPALALPSSNGNSAP